MDQSGTDDFAKLGQLIQDIRVALLTTVDRDGHFHTRPVQTLQLMPIERSGFFTDLEQSEGG